MFVVIFLLFIDLIFHVLNVIKIIAKAVESDIKWEGYVISQLRTVLIDLFCFDSTVLCNLIALRNNSIK